MPSDRDQDRAPLRHSDRDADDRHRRKERDRDSHRERERDRDRDRSTRDREKDRDRDKDRNGASRNRTRDGHRSREKDVDERAHSKEKDDRDRHRERKRDRERDKDRERPREREKEREKERGRAEKRDREERDGDRYKGEREKRERLGHDSRREEDSRRSGHDARPSRPSAREEKRNGKERKPEMSEEEKEVMERRARVEAWQAKKRALDEEKERAEEEAAANRKAWNLEDDASDDEAPAAAAGTAQMNDDEVDPLDEFMLDVGSKVQADFATLDPDVAKDAFEVNEQLSKAGIKLELPSAAGAVAPQHGDTQMDTGKVAGSSKHDEVMKDLAPAETGLGVGLAAKERSPKPNVLGAGLFEGKDISPATVAVKSEGVELEGGTVTLDQVAVKQEPGLGLGMPVQLNLGGALGGVGGGKSLAIGRGIVVKREIAFAAKKPLVSIKTESKPNSAGGSSEKRKAKLRVAAKKRRNESIQRAAPKALNPYGSDESDSDGDAGADNGEEEEEIEEEKELEDSEWAKAVQSGRISKGEKLVPVDHSTVTYPPFRKNFYIESPDIVKMTAEEVAAVHASMGGAKVRGRDTPKPIRNWAQCGLPVSIMQTLKRNNFQDPLPVQALALPVVMSGRDCIGVATTGSGKTLAYVLPMLRNVNDAVVRGLDESFGNGPLGLIIAPTRELVQQISKEVRTFAKPLDLAVVAAYGGSGVKEQINGLKRGAHIVVCTPGRMIDILVTSNGSVTNLRRVQMLVIDEADRMFDMGFEPQISRIIGQVRPDRQTVLFSATFPKAVEVLARAILSDPIEVQVGGRSIVSSNIKQVIELRSNDEERFARLLEILGELATAEDPGKTLIFVNSQDKCSNLFQQLLNYGYANQMLHGDMQQTDRESVISDFKTGVCSVLVATSVAARGLDVRELSLVINYDTPNHLEEYVHRCGRTGRAGAAGTAVTFLSPHDDQYAPDLVKALRDSKAPVPADLEKLCKGFESKRKQGKAVQHGSGYGGSGFRFDQHEDDVHLAIKMRHAVDLKNPNEDGDDAAGDAARAALNTLRERTEAHGDGEAARIAAKYCITAEQPPECINVSDDKRREAQRIALQAANKLMGASRVTENMGGGIRKVLPTGVTHPASNADAQAALIMAAQSAASKIAGNMGVRQSREHALKMQVMQQAAAARPVATASEHFEADLLINDFPQAARYHVTHRDTIANISERTGAAIIIRGQYYAPGQPVPDDDTKLYLLIEGPTLQVVKHAKALIKEIIEEKTEKSMRRETGAMGRFQIT